ncbi:MAG: hypothetical protein WC797_01465 [Candidatus Paceibacterota bacterium]|jgi:hypothetical protein
MIKAVVEFLANHWDVGVAIMICFGILALMFWLDWEQSDKEEGKRDKVLNVFWRISGFLSAIGAVMSFWSFAINLLRAILCR